MSYADRDTTGEKTFSLIASLLTVGAIGYAMVFGLAINVLRTATPNLKMVEIAMPPPPPPKQPPPPPKKLEQKPTSPPIVAPPPIVQPPVVSTPSVVTVPTPPLAPPVPVPKVAPPPPLPLKPSEASPVQPKGDPGSWITTDDYPPAALRDGKEGRTRFRLGVGADGRVTGCTVVSSSGFDELDQTACRILQRRARFAPAMNAAGQAVASSYSSSVLWRIPKD